MPSAPLARHRPGAAALLAVGALRRGARDVGLRGPHARRARRDAGLRGAGPGRRSPARWGEPARVSTAPSVVRLVDPIPGVRSFTYDRSFPHTLRVIVRPEVPVLVVRARPDRRASSPRRGRVIRAARASAALAPAAALGARRARACSVGGVLPPIAGGAATSLAPLRVPRLPGGVASVRAGKDELTLVLGGGPRAAPRRPRRPAR